MCNVRFGQQGLDQERREFALWGEDVAEQSYIFLLLKISLMHFMCMQLLVSKDWNVHI